LMIGGITRAVRTYSWLKQYGTEVTATVIDVYKDSHIRDDGSTCNRCHLTAEWQHPNANQTYIFRSVIPTYPPRKCRPGSHVNVLIDPNNPKRYHMELP
jgi:hypothetical protein